MRGILKGPKEKKNIEEISEEEKEAIKFGGTGLPDMLYKGDMELLDRYLKFTEELLRLALLSITGLVSFLSLVYKREGNLFDVSEVPLKGLYFSSLCYFAWLRQQRCFIVSRA